MNSFKKSTKTFDYIPLAEQMRPESLDDFIGQEHILAPGKLLFRMLKADRVPSIILWGPPGCGKTTLARIIAKFTSSSFVSLSAVNSGVKDARLIISDAEELKKQGQNSILFVDEIHRFNKSQQDLFLPYIENGTITFIGATTENPSFEVNSPLLSRCRVFHLRELNESDIFNLLSLTVDKINKGKVLKQILPNTVYIEDSAKRHIARLCEGDARDALNALELAILSTKAKNAKVIISLTDAEEAIQQKFIRYDKSEDGHYDAISALHKSLRSGDTDASLHYLARMIEAGEDPLYIVRRMVRFASEDIGMADPNALVIAVACQQAVHFIGLPEANDALAQCVIYLSLAPKSRAVDDAYARAVYDVKNMRLDPIPLKIRNAPTKLMRDFGFGKNYQMYDKSTFLPPNLKDRKYWQN